MFEAVLGLSSVFFVMAAFLSIPFVLVKITNFENDKTSKWSRFFKCVSENPTEFRTLPFYYLDGVAAYYFFYAFIQTHEFANLLMVFAVISAMVLMYDELLDAEYKWLHFKILKLLSLISFSLILVALEYSVWITTFIGVFSFIVISTQCRIERTLLYASKKDNEIDK